ncbi:MAG: butyrate kinase [Parasporobacterium sp.]|nr:butyrate kinase [Parasporobacterium sp.]
MKEYTIITINPGSSSTKVGVYRGGQVILDKNVDHDTHEFDHCKTFAEQEPIRTRKIMEILEDADIDLKKVDAVSGRGVGVHSCEGGTYEINETAFLHAQNDVEKIHHPATLGIVIAKKLGDQLGVPSYFVNPMSVDELSDVARMTGVKGIYRPSHGHPLNEKQVAIHHSELQGKRYADCNYVVLHMGGGISIAAHRKGRIVDSTRSGDGQGTISPNRSGDLCIDDILTLMNKRGIDLKEINMLAARKGGLVDLTGTDDVRQVKERIAAGDKWAELCYHAMIYTIIKWTCMMAGALGGQVDGILMTGGLAYDEDLVREVTENVQWIAPVSVYPGSHETEALGAGVERVLSGQETAKTYSGRPVWEGFDYEP